MTASKPVLLSLFAILFLALSACGQKGPLEVEPEPELQVESQDSTK